MVDYSDTMEVYDTTNDCKLNEYMEMYMYQTHTPCYSLTFVISLISNSFCSKAIGQTNIKLHIEPSWGKGTQIYQISWGHMTKMAAMPMYSKIL